MGTIADKLTYLNDTKALIKGAIEFKGVQVPSGTTFRDYYLKILQIDGGGGGGAGEQAAVFANYIYDTYSLNDEAIGGVIANNYVYGSYTVET